MFDPVARAQQRRAEWLRPLVRRQRRRRRRIAAGVMGLAAFSLHGCGRTRCSSPPARPLVWVLAVLVSRGYEARRMGDGPDEFQSLLRAAFGVVAAMGVVAYSFQVLLPRRLVLIAIPLTACSAWSTVTWPASSCTAGGTTGQAMRRTLIVGEPTAVREVVTDLASVKHHGYEIVGACVPVPGPEIAENLDLGVLGSVSEVPQVVVDNDIDSVIVVGAQLERHAAASPVVGAGADRRRPGRRARVWSRSPAPTSRCGRRPGCPCCWSSRRPRGWAGCC